MKCANTLTARKIGLLEFKHTQWSNYSKLALPGTFPCTIWSAQVHGPQLRMTAQAKIKKNKSVDLLWLLAGLQSENYIFSHQVQSRGGLGAQKVSKPNSGNNDITTMKCRSFWRRQNFDYIFFSPFRTLDMQIFLKWASKASPNILKTLQHPKFSNLENDWRH